jgi:hypothetical protein
MPNYDLNGDGVVNQKDIDILTTYMGTFVNPADPVSVQADFNEDGIIDMSEVSELVAYINDHPPETKPDLLKAATPFLIIGGLIVGGWALSKKR